MNFIYLDYKGYIDLINAKNEVILGVVNENSEDSKLIVGVLAQLSKKYCLNDLYLKKRSIYKEINKDFIDILPQTLNIKHQKIKSISFGFKQVNLMEEELKLG